MPYIAPTAEPRPCAPAMARASRRHPCINYMAITATTTFNPKHQRAGTQGLRRSEEHTSELQSLMRISYAVFCLKKKNRIPKTTNTTHHPSTSIRQTQVKNINHTIRDKDTQHST